MTTTDTKIENRFFPGKRGPKSHSDRAGGPKSAFAQLLLAERYRLNLTQEQVAAICNVSKKAIENWENDRTAVMEVTQEGVLGRLYAYGDQQQNLLTTGE